MAGQNQEATLLSVVQKVYQEMKTPEQFVADYSGQTFTCSNDALLLLRDCFKECQKQAWNEAVEASACAVRDTRWGWDGDCGASYQVSKLLLP